MNALVLDAPGRLQWQQTESPAPRPGEALVKVRRCGVCGTDLHALSGRQPFFSYPRRLGHELCVEVLGAPTGNLAPGALCAVEPYYACGHCPACRGGKPNCCRHLRVLGVHIDGGHAPLLSVPVAKLHPAPGLTPDAIALVEPLAIGAHGVERAELRAGEPVVIVGLGPIGLAAAIFAQAAGADVALVDTSEHRLRFAAETLSLGRAVPAGADLAGRLQGHFGQLPAAVIDATGNARAMRGAFELAEHGGRVVFLGLFIGDVAFDDPNFHRRELTLHASRAARPETFRSTIERIAAGRIAVEPLITHRLRFTELAATLPALAAQPSLVKAIIDFDDLP